MKAIILDLGNVLVFHDNEKLFGEMAKAFGVSRELMRERLDPGLWERVNRGLLPGDALRQEMASRLGAQIAPREWLALWNCHFSINVPMVKCVERLVGAMPLVLLSNTHDQHIAWLRPRLPILERFDSLVLSCEVGMVKPERAIYALAVERADVRPDEAVFFDDVAAYVEGAQAAGLQARQFTTVERFRSDLEVLGVGLQPPSAAQDEGAVFPVAAKE